MAEQAEEKKQQVNDDAQASKGRPSIVPVADFNDKKIKEAAITLREAMKGAGTDEGPIITITARHTRAQRMKIMKRYNEEYEGRNLYEDLKSELGSNFKKLALGFWVETEAKYAAQEVADAVKGVGYSAAALNEIILTKTNKELKELQEAYEQLSGEKLIDRIEKETYGKLKIFNNDPDYYALIKGVLEGKRPVDEECDAEKIKMEVEVLNRMLMQEDEKKAKEKFVEVFTTRSWKWIKEISGMFQDVSKKYTLQSAIAKVLKGNTAKGLQTIADFASQPFDYFAKLLRDSMEGVGTDEKTLIRVLVLRAEIDLRDIGIVFGQRYGKGKTLQRWIKDDLGGDFEKLALAICGLSD